MSAKTILLGEAPKRDDGFAFDADSWTTNQIAEVLDVHPRHLNKVFFVMNVFEEPQKRAWRGYDQFSIDDAVNEIDRIDFPSQRIICLGSRVARAMELALKLPDESIAENEFRAFNRTARGRGWRLARIPHPSGLRGQERRDGLVLPLATRRFLVRAADGLE